MIKLLLNFFQIDAATQRALNGIVARSLRLVTAALGWLYAFLTISHAWWLTGDLRSIMMVIAASSAVLLFGMWFWQHRHPVPVSLAHPVGTVLLLVVAINSFVHLGIAQEPPLTTNIALLMIGTGLFFLSARWFFAVLTVTLVGGMIMIGAIGLTSEWVPFVFFLGQAAFVATLAFLIRYRAMKLMHQVLVENEEQNRDLKAILELAISNEWRYRRLAEAAHEGILIHANGFILDANPAFASMLGYELYELIGESPYDHLVPEDVLIAKAYADDPDPKRYELRAIRKDGQEIIIDVRGQTIMDGQSRYRLVTVQDVTIERAAQQTLKRQALIFENISDSVVLTDTDGLIIDCNPATERLFGYEKEKLLGKNLHEIWHQPFPSEFPEIAKAIRENDRWYGEVSFTREDASIGICEAIALPLMNDEGQRMATIAVSRDITGRKRTEQALREAKNAAETASRAKSAFLAHMSHELRTPLTAIIGYCELLEEEADDRGYETLIPDLNKINSASRHLLSVIKDILDIAKVEAGETTVDLQKFPLAGLIADIQLTTQTLVEKNGNRFIITTGVDVGDIISDEAKLRQILINLVGNAAKFTENGDIHVQTAGEKSPVGINGYRITVSDTGIGIEKEQLSGLFEPFTQADSTPTRRYEGTGLGLAIVHRFCEMLGGTITVESQPAAGSTFSIWIPADIDDVMQVQNVQVG